MPKSDQRDYTIMPISPWITQSKLAKDLGVSRAAVCLAIKSGRVTALNGKLVHQITAAKQFLESSKRQHANSDHTLPVDTAEDLLTSLSWGTQTIETKTKEATTLKTKTNETELPSLQQSRLQREHYQAELSKLQLALQRKELVPATQVKKEAYQMGRNIREALSNLADRLSHELAGEVDATRIHQLLTDEHRAVLMELTNG